MGGSKSSTLPAICKKRQSVEFYTKFLKGLTKQDCIFVNTIHQIFQGFFETKVKSFPKVEFSYENIGKYVFNITQSYFDDRKVTIRKLLIACNVLKTEEHIVVPRFFSGGNNDYIKFEVTNRYPFNKEKNGQRDVLNKSLKLPGIGKSLHNKN